VGGRRARQRAPRALGFAGAVVLLAASIAPAVAQQLYTWTDENGVVHYTADPWSIPPQFRPSDLPAQRLATPRETAAPPTAGSKAATVVQFTPGEPIIVSARLNGAPMALLLDTGADRTLVSPAAAARAGYERTIVPGGSSVRILGVTGSVVAAQVIVPVLDIAGTSFGPLWLIVHDAGIRGVDGLLGRDILDAFTVTIDAAAGRATLTPR
jgi:hypothetical protein